MRGLLKFTKDAVQSRAGWVAVALHHSLAVYYFAGLETFKSYYPEGVLSVPLLAGRFTDFSDLGAFLFLINPLPLLIGNVLLRLLFLLCPNISGLTLSWLYIALAFVFSSLQWLLLNHFSAKMFALYQESYEHTTTNR